MCFLVLSIHAFCRGTICSFFTVYRMVGSRTLGQAPDAKYNTVQCLELKSFTKTSVLLSVFSRSGSHVVYRGNGKSILLSLQKFILCAQGFGFLSSQASVTVLPQHSKPGEKYNLEFFLQNHIVLISDYLNFVKTDLQLNVALICSHDHLCGWSSQAPYLYQ